MYEGRVRGAILIGVVKRAKREPAVHKLLAPELEAFLEKERVVVSDWYPLAISEGLVLAIERAVTGGNTSPLPWAFGVEMAKVQLTGPYRAFLMRGEPQRQILRLPVMWRGFFDDGDWKCIPRGPGAIDLQFSGSSAKTDATCRSAGGFLEESSRMAGAKVVQVTKTSCAHAGAPFCGYEVRWG
ncbi:MAG TPA: hypothetical protein VMW35_21690 [Myxococcota bacterium]|jgi:hypothetical protein|nr:hypothetical protein [Myxococcota bacterium]